MRVDPGMSQEMGSQKKEEQRPFKNKIMYDAKQTLEPL